MIAPDLAPIDPTPKSRAPALDSRFYGSGEVSSRNFGVGCSERSKARFCPYIDINGALSAACRPSCAGAWIYALFYLSYYSTRNTR